jgi:uncharacterized RDD family membrane protein YckC
MQQTTPVTSQTMSQPHWGAGLGLRAIAQIIDLVVHNLVVYITAIAFGVVIGIYALVVGQQPSFLVSKLQTSSLILYVFPLIGYVIYHTICEGLHGSTLGKLIVRIQVVDGNGDRCSLSSAFIRSLAFYVDGLFFGMVAVLSMNRSELKQRYGDKWAHTVVVERSQLSQSQKPSGSRFLVAFLVAMILDGAIYALSLFLKMLL